MMSDMKESELDQDTAADVGNSDWKMQLCSSASAVADDSCSNTKVAFRVDTTRIRSVPSSEQNLELQNLGLQVYNQDVFEQGVIAQVDEEIVAQERRIAMHMLQKELAGINTDIRLCEEELRHTEKVLSMMGSEKSLSREAVRQLHSVRSQKENKTRQLKTLNARKHSTTQRLNTVTRESIAAAAAAANDDDDQDDDGETAEKFDDLLGLTEASSQETESNRMIRLGEMTPFGTLMPNQPAAATRGTPAARNSAPQMSAFDKFLLDQEKKKKQAILKNRKLKMKPAGRGFPKRMNVKKADKRSFFNNKTSSSSKQRSCHDSKNDDDDDDDDDDGDDCWLPDDDDEYFEDSEDDDLKTSCKRKRKGEDVSLDFGEPHGNAKKRRRKDGAFLDDGDEGIYRQRLRDYDDEMLRKAQTQEEEEEESGSDAEFDGGFQVPGRIWNKLYRYQKTGVRWLWELHCQRVGGILGDEMGLGKTIQLIGFLAGLRHSKLKDQSSVSKYVGLGPTLIVCPATIMHQWVKEIHTWWPIARVAVLHSTGTANIPEASLVQRIVRSCGVLILGYSTVVSKQDILLKYDWHYVILDEGHKIRNPDAQMTLACKQFRTCHCLILSGSPMQNNLKELWSLFDFVFPGKLGTLPDFMQQFSVPIVQGGYANASKVQVQTAYKCACVLRDTIAPYLLRRMKSDVKVSLQLPDKSEQVLFCRLSQHQRDVYREYLDSKECHQILAGRFMVFPGLITLRKICNHPDLSTGGPKVFGDEPENANQSREMEFGFWGRSGKMIVVEALLNLWKKQTHKVLLFTQSRQMLNILESFVQRRGYSYLRMDGTTTISSRQPLVELFNTDPTVFLFLLTTRVGGLGINLTGADRVIIYDPDWNPSTDTQARERAWRIGQTKQVTIYRLLTTGTIEEKIYHRQIFKQFLTNRVLKDPKQRRFFKSNDLYELFTLGDDSLESGTETSAIFAGTNSDARVSTDRSKAKRKKKNLFDALKEKGEELGLNMNEREDEPDAEDDRRATQMRELAKHLSQRISLTKQDDSMDINDKQSIKPTSTVPAGLPKLTKSGSLEVGAWRKDKTAAKGLSENIEKERSSRRGSKRPKKSRKRRSTVIDGEKISFVDRSTVYRRENETAEEEQKSSEQDDYVLRRLLKKSGSIHSAMQHDRIMMSSDPDYVLVENEAEQVARRAVQALKESRSRCRQGSTLGVPTWTGQNGVAGAPVQSSRPHFGQKRNPAFQATAAKPSIAMTATSSEAKTSCSVDSGVAFDGTSLVSSNPQTRPNSLLSSSELLARITARSDTICPVTSHDSDEMDIDLTSHPVYTAPSGDELELLTEIRNFIACEASVDGQATTTELLEKFKSRLPQSKSAIFKAMLKQISGFYRTNGLGVWRLKPEFR